MADTTTIISSKKSELILPRQDSLIGRVKADGKFFFRGNDKFFIKGVTYGPFAPASHGAPFPEKDVAEKDFALMAELGANCLRTFTVPPAWLVDLGASYGLYFLIGIHGSWHHCFLDSRKLQDEIRLAVKQAVETYRSHPAVLAYIVGNEIPPDVIRWHGPKRIQKFLHELVLRIKASDPDALVSYSNFPSTEYLDLRFTDFLAFNVYLHNPENFRRYLYRLHNLAGDRPLILTELGIDSIREGREGQAEILSWQLPTGFETGLAGQVIFSWTDEWFNANTAVTDWAFGLVDENREPKPSFHAVQKHYTQYIPPALSQYPKVSVVVCAYNAERTMEQCLVSLGKIQYPDYEVIIVNDGSRDRTLEIAKRFPNFQIISQENKGLSVARNVGIRAAKGEIVAFTDSDCVVDPDWLTYLVSRLLSSDFVAVGGPNLPPPENKLVPSCVAVSPGGPTHVLLNDEIAEHIPGCNMAFYKRALLEIGGFNPVFTAAGDDVDVCWRLQDKRYKIGFSPAAMVWHFRRNTVKDYLNQQRGYGKAESLLYFQHPDRFNVIGQTRWLGRIYGDVTGFLFSRKPVIYYGTFGRGMFQTLYEPALHPLHYLPFTLEWNVLGAVLLLFALISKSFLAAAALPLLYTLTAVIVQAASAELDPRFRGARGRLLVSLLIYLGPLVRSYERYRWRFRRLSGISRVSFHECDQKPRIHWLKQEMSLSYWTEAGIEKEDLLRELIDMLMSHNYSVFIDQGWSEWDIQIRRKIWSRILLQTASENHWGLRRLLRVKCRAQMSQTAWTFIGGCLGLAALAWLFQLPVIFQFFPLFGGLIILILCLYDGFRLSRIVYHALEIVAEKLSLLPVGSR